MNKPLTVLLLLFISLLQAQEKFSLNGVIRDSSSNETLYGANVLIPELNLGTTTNEYGFYSLKLPVGTYKVQFSFVGYSQVVRDIKITSNTTSNVDLEESSQYLEEVVVSENVERTNIRKPEMSVTRLDISTIKDLPVLFGEVDVIKSLLLLPGISNAGEGSSGYNVRGGAVDQNLILLDEATIYNASHLFGLFSVFNPDAIKNLKLYKGGIPAKYGGRVSSVLEIYQKDGNSRNFEGTGGIGLISSRLLFEGPIKEEKGSFLIGGRSSYAHLFLKLTDNPNSAYFYDLNTKLTYRLNDKNTLLFSGYFGRDVFNINENFKNSYGNSVLNLRWNHVFSNNVFTNLSAIYSDYYYGLILDYVGFDWNSGIKNLNIKYGFDHYLNEKLTFNYGIQSTWYEFNPGEIEPSTESSGINPFELTKKYAIENALYFSAEQNFTQNLSIEYGLRFSSFLRLGQENLNLYPNDNPLVFKEEFGIYEEADPIGNLSLSRGKVQKAFHQLEPRIAVAYSIDNDQSIKLSYNRMSQYLHLITNTSSPTPLDVWAPSGKYIDPQILDQLAIGYFKNFNSEEFTLEVEAFYKDVQDRLDYIDGANLIANNAIEQVLLSGQAKAYGLEFLLKKNFGDFTGWFAYTYSKAKQKTPGRTPVETGINNGNWYHTNYDKPHDLSITAGYEINRKWKINANWVYQTGLPTTFPSGHYRYENMTIPVYSQRNSNRLPDYHRLDLSATFAPKAAQEKNFRSSWNFGIYNIYNRKNAVSMSFRKNNDLGKNEAVRLSLFGIVPSITYNFEF